MLIFFSVLSVYVLLAYWEKKGEGVVFSRPLPKGPTRGVRARKRALHGDRGWRGSPPSPKRWRCVPRGVTQMRGGSGGGIRGAVNARALSLARKAAYKQSTHVTTAACRACRSTASRSRARILLRTNQHHSFRISELRTQYSHRRVTRPSDRSSAQC